MNCIRPTYGEEKIQKKDSTLYRTRNHAQNQTRKRTCRWPHNLVKQYLVRTQCFTHKQLMVQALDELAVLCSNLSGKSSGQFIASV
jgi:hypothetical protein